MSRPWARLPSTSGPNLFYAEVIGERSWSTSNAKCIALSSCPLIKDRAGFTGEYWTLACPRAPILTKGKHEQLNSPGHADRGLAVAATRDFRHVRGSPIRHRLHAALAGGAELFAYGKADTHRFHVIRADRPEHVLSGMFKNISRAEFEIILSTIVIN